VLGEDYAILRAGSTTHSRLAIGVSTMDMHFPREVRQDLNALRALDIHNDLALQNLKERLRAPFNQQAVVTLTGI